MVTRRTVAVNYLSGPAESCASTDRHVNTRDKNSMAPEAHLPQNGPVTIIRDHQYGYLFRPPWNRSGWFLKPPNDPEHEIVHPPPCDRSTLAEVPKEASKVHRQKAASHRGHRTSRLCVRTATITTTSRAQATGARRRASALVPDPNKKEARGPRQERGRPAEEGHCPLLCVRSGQDLDYVIEPWLGGRSDN